MKRKSILMVGILGVVLAAVAGVWLWNWVLGDTEEASAPIQALPVQSGPIQTVPAAATETRAEATQPLPTTPAETQAVETTSPSAARIFTISQTESKAQFTIYEELLGQPKDVVGTTDQVAGEIEVDLGDLNSAQVGVIQVNARTLVTDDDRRNRAIRNRILNTDSFELITFTPLEITGLAGSASPGQTFEFQISGDLTIRDITKPVVFDVTGQVISENQLAGSASATIQRSDYGLVIPRVQSVANVGEEITLEIHFVANAP
jgi:polyisoprenoid-binding protein YceI